MMRCLVLIGLFLCGFVSADEWRNIPLEQSITAVQPMTGLVLWSDHPSSDHAAIQLEYSYMPFDVVAVNKEPSKWDWSSVEKRLDHIASHGHQAILRFYYVYPGKKTTVPSYIKALPNYKEIFAKSEGKKTGFPDWSHAELKAFTKRFYSEFAKRYDDDPRIAFLQVGFGLWGEYHIYDPKVVAGQNFPAKAFQIDFLQHLDSAFRLLCWSISIDARDESTTPFQSNKALTQLRFGLFDDSFLHAKHHEYNKDCFTFFGAEKRMHCPVGGELSYYSKHDQKHALDLPKGSHGIRFENLAAQYQISYMIANDQPRYQGWDRIQEAGMGLGYRFAITEFKTSENESVVKVANRGIAPIYYDAFVAVNGVRSSVSLKGLRPECSLECRVAVGRGEPVLTIECDRLVKGQQVGYEAHLVKKGTAAE